MFRVPSESLWMCPVDSWPDFSARELSEACLLTGDPGLSFPGTNWPRLVYFVSLILRLDSAFSSAQVLPLLFFPLRITLLILGFIKNM